MIFAGIVIGFVVSVFFIVGLLCCLFYLDKYKTAMNIDKKLFYKVF